MSPRTPFDQFAKALMIDRFSPFGTVITEYEVTPEPQYADLWWTPDPKRRPGVALDVLERMARSESLWEFFHKAPSRERLLDCWRKLLAHHARRLRVAHAAGAPAPTIAPLWVVSAGAPLGAMRGLSFRRAYGWPDGFFVAPPNGALRVVVLPHLAQSRDTLMLRLFGAGLTLTTAIAQLESLPDDAPERMLCRPHLERF